MLDVRSVVKLYEDVRAVDDVSLQVGRGEFLTLLGPSGSGKTTTLRMVAGFLAPDGGQVVLDGRDITYLPPHRRGIGMVFQNYALFPQMTLFENIAFPLRMRRVEKQELRRSVQQALELVGLGAFAKRRPQELSGGQQQRVALARALVFRPPLVLMDEPMGALDRKLREQLQVELADLCRELGMTVVYVTHDQDEALRLSDRVAVFSEGRIAQIGSPREVYDDPASEFVAGFLGDANILPGRLIRGAAEPKVETAWGPIHLTAAAAPRDPGGPVAAMVRPEHVRVDAAGDAGDGLRGQVLATEFVGARARIVVRVADDCTIRADQAVRSIDDLPVGKAVSVRWRVEDVRLVSCDQETD